ncbi:MAG: chemotaxis protein CheW [Leptospirales bacterium]|nr:chemotaxis protein CheW [Leptospirales bacterium]
MAISLGEYQDVFIEEADELLQELNQDLVRFEKEPEDIEIINNIFRAAHTLKSSAAFVGLVDLSELAHQMEDLLQGVRDGVISISSEIIDVVFKCFDTVNAVVDSISAGEEPDQDIASVINQIHRVANAAKGKTAPKTAVPEQGIKGGENFIIPQTKLEVDDIKIIRDAVENGLSCYEFAVYVDPAAQMKSLKQELVMASLERSSTIIKLPDEEENLASGNVFKTIVASHDTEEELVHSCNVDQIIKIDVRAVTLDKQDGRTVVRFDPVGEFTTGAAEDDMNDESRNAEQDDDSLPSFAAASRLSKKAIDDDGRRKAVPTSKTVKVAIEKLDQLMNNVGELVIINSGFYRLYNDISNVIHDKAIMTEFKNRMDEMARISKDLQSGIMKTRMFPVGQVFSRFERLVRDLAHESGKNIELVINGEDTELDKKVIDSIGDPLLHLVRNAVDHGIESNGVRNGLGKPEAAAIILNAYQSGSQIVVEVSDDGRGLDIEKIKAKAVEKGLVERDAVDSLTENDIFSFVFLPGFSTADKVTDISGRGVGMNVVRETVMELNGNVAIRTEKNVGTTFQLEFPLTLAIISAVLARVGDEVYAVPLSDIDETITVSYSDITTIEGHEVVNLRGEVLSLLRLSRFVGKKSTLKKEDKIPIIVVGYAKRKIGLMVDALEGKMEIVIKSLEQNYKTVDGIAGASILGDGSICLILDVASMVNMAITDQNAYYSSKTMFDGEIGITDDQHMEIIIETQTVPEQSETIVVPDGEEPEKTEAEFGIEEEIEIEVEAEEKVETKEELEEEFKEETEELDEIDKMFAGMQIRTEEEAGEGEEAGTVELDTQTEDSEKSAENAPEQIAQEQAAQGEHVEQRVRDTLDEFRRELKQNIHNALDAKDLGDAAELFPIAALKQLQLIANIGASRAAESMSRIISRQVGLSIPDVSITPIEKIAERTGCTDGQVYISGIVTIDDKFGSLLLLFAEQMAFELIDALYGSSTREAGVLDEYCESILREITNIVGSSLLNVIAEKVGHTIKPNVPTLHSGNVDKILEAADIAKDSINGNVIIMDAAFFFNDDELLTHLILVPGSGSMPDFLRLAEM